MTDNNNNMTFSFVVNLRLAILIPYLKNNFVVLLKKVHLELFLDLQLTQSNYRDFNLKE